MQEKKINSGTIRIVPHLSMANSRAVPTYLKDVLPRDSGEKVQGLIKDFPDIPGPTVPKLAIPKDQISSSKTDESAYSWITQSIAIIEYLEDLCDINPELSSVPSLRGGDNILQRAYVKGLLYHAESLWSLVGTSLLLGSSVYNSMTEQDAVHLPSSHAVRNFTEKSCLSKLDELLGLECDFEAVQEDVVGSASIADITLYATFVFLRDVHGCDVAKGYANIERLIAAFERRTSSIAGIPAGGYPEWAKACRYGFKERVWVEADFRHVDSRFE